MQVRRTCHTCPMFKICQVFSFLFPVKQGTTACQAKSDHVRSNSLAWEDLCLQLLQVGLSAEGKKGGPCNPPAPGLEKDVSRQGTEKGLGEPRGLLPSVQRAVNKTPGMEVWSFLSLASGTMEWSSGSGGWQALRKHWLQNAHYVHSTQVATDLVTYLSQPQEVPGSWSLDPGGIRVLFSPKKEEIMKAWLECL